MLHQWSPPPNLHSKIRYQSLCVLTPMPTLLRIHPMCFGISTRWASWIGISASISPRNQMALLLSTPDSYGWFSGNCCTLAPLRTQLSPQGQPFHGSSPHTSLLLFQVQAEVCRGSGRGTVSSNSQKMFKEMSGPTIGSSYGSAQKVEHLNVFVLIFKLSQILVQQQESDSRSN